MKIRVCDDHQTSADEWVDDISEAVGDGCSVERLAAPLETIQELVERKKLADEGETFDAAKRAAFDDVDILVVDFDLIHIDEKGNRTTGEGVARLVKSYSECGSVIVLNQFSKVDFDLSMTGHLASFADINVDSGCVGQVPLWRSDVSSPFHPSYWTAFLDVFAARRAFTEKIEGALDTSILKLLGLVATDLKGITDPTFSFLSESADALEGLTAVTPRSFVTEKLGETEAGALLSSSPRIAAGLVTSRIIKWLDRGILRPLDAMIDAPHLVAQRPYLANANADQLAEPAYWSGIRGKEAEAMIERVQEVAYLRIVSELLGRAVYGVARIEADGELRAKSDEFDFAPTADVVFAEDTSRFIPREKATPFRAGFGNFNDRRFVEKIEKRYGPSRHFAFGD